MSYAPGAGPELPWEWSSILGGSCVLGELFYCLTSVVPFAGVFVLMLLLRLVLRRQWLASLALYLFMVEPPRIELGLRVEAGGRPRGEGEGHGDLRAVSAA